MVDVSFNGQAYSMEAPELELDNQLMSTIILTVGFNQWYRMNALRVESLYSTKVDFLCDMHDCLGSVRQKVLVPYLKERLTPYRLALPDGYTLSARA